MIELELIRRREQWARSFSSNTTEWGFDIELGEDTYIQYQGGNSVIWGYDKYVSVGNDSIEYSFDGVDWFDVPYKDVDLIGNNWQSVAYGNGTFVAVSENGDYRCAYSTDGLYWYVDNDFIEDDIEWRDVCYGDDGFVVMSLDNVAIQDINGEWDIVYSDTYVGNCIAYGNGAYVIVGDTVDVVRSTDGTTWTKITLPNSRYTIREKYAITFGNNNFVAVGFDTYLYSTDGITWTGNHIINTMSPVYKWNCITYDPSVNRYWALGDTASDNRNLLRINLSGSPIVDYLDSTTSNDFKSICYGTPGVLASKLGDMSGNSPYRLGKSTTTTIYWGSRKQLIGGGRRTAYGNGKFVSLSMNDIAVSEDGITWKGYLGYNFDGYPVYGDGYFFVLDFNGYVNRSTDGIIWERFGNFNGTTTDLAYYDGELLSLVNSGNEYSIHYMNVITGGVTSMGALPDIYDNTGLENGTWNRFILTTNGNYTVYGVGYDENYNSIYLAFNNQLWLNQLSDTLSFYDTEYKYLKDRYFIISGSIKTSFNGIDFTEQWSAGAVNIQSVAYGDDLFIGVGSGGGLGKAIYSLNGVDWLEIPNLPNTIEYISTVAYGDGKFVVWTNTDPYVITTTIS